MCLWINPQLKFLLVFSFFTHQKIIIVENVWLNMVSHFEYLISPFVQCTKENIVCCRKLSRLLSQLPFTLHVAIQTNILCTVGRHLAWSVKYFNLSILLLCQQLTNSVSKRIPLILIFSFGLYAVYRCRWQQLIFFRCPLFYYMSIAFRCARCSYVRMTVY